MNNYELFLEALCESRTQHSEVYNYFVSKGVLMYSYRKGHKKQYVDKQTMRAVHNWYSTFKETNPADLLLKMEHRATLYELALLAYLKVYGEGK